MKKKKIIEIEMTMDEIEERLGITGKIKQIMSFGREVVLRTEED